MPRNTSPCARNVPRLTFPYAGIGYRKGSPEFITGAFEVVGRSRTYLVLDNGETGDAHGRWLVPARRAA